MSVRHFASQRPVLAAVLCAGLQFLLTGLILKGGQLLAPAAVFPKVKMVAFASTIILPLVLAQAMGSWRQLDLAFGKMKSTPVFLVSLLPSVMWLAMGVEQDGKRDIGSDVLIQFFNAFGEELLFRGVIFAILWRLPQWKAILIGGVLFGSMHLLHFFMGAGLGDAMWKFFLTGISGMMFTAVRYRTGSLWLLVFLHMFLNLSKMYSGADAFGVGTVHLLEWIQYGFELALTGYVIFRPSPREGGSSQRSDREEAKEQPVPVSEQAFRSR